jgi:hypothetical protein
MLREEDAVVMEHDQLQSPYVLILLVVTYLEKSYGCWATTSRLEAAAEPINVAARLQQWLLHLSR